MKELKVGLIEGRHPLPVDQYIFEGEIQNVLDFDFIRSTVSTFIETYCEVHTDQMGCGLNQADYTSVECYCGGVNLVVYVTGLTAVTAELIRQCALNGISLTLMHFDRESGEYLPQRIF